jgi:hypothetical protein
VPTGSGPLGGRKVRKIGLLRTFVRSSRQDSADKAVKIGPNWPRPNSRVISRQIGQSMGNLVSISSSKRP